MKHQFNETTGLTKQTINKKLIDKVNVFWNKCLMKQMFDETNV
jgi:hypothetical protein